MRTGCAILVAIFMPGLLWLTAYAWITNPSIWTFAAGVVMGLGNGVFWFGVGRAIFDAYLTVWGQLPTETDETE